MAPEDIEREFARLAARLARIEERLGIPAEAASTPPAAPVTPREAAVSEPRLPPLETVRPSVESVEAVVAEAMRQPDNGVGTRPLFQAPQPTAHDAGSLEFRIGSRWMAWIGAVVVVLAVGFFIKLAYDQGWLGRLSPLAKCLSVATFGGLLIAAGEVALRRIGRTAAVGLFGAGLGTLYLTSYATFRYFDLLSQRGAFLLLACVALLGFAITIHGRLVAVGVLAVIGGYLTPVLLSQASAAAWALPAYLIMLLGVSLALSVVSGEGRRGLEVAPTDSAGADRGLPARRGGEAAPTDSGDAGRGLEAASTGAAAAAPYRALRYVALSGHALMGMAWAVSEGVHHRTIALTFLAVSWLLLTAEVVLAARRDQSALGNTVASFLFTTWFVTVGCWALSQGRWTRDSGMGLFAAVIGVLNALIAFRPGAGIRALRVQPQSALEKLTVTLWAEAGALLAVAIALQFAGYGQTVGWLAMGLACVEAGRRLPSKEVNVFGLLVGSLALFRVVCVDSQSSVLAAELWQIGSVSITKWSLLALVAIVATQTAARRVHSGADGDRLPRVLSGLSIVGWLGLCVVQCSGLAITGGWLCSAALLLAGQRFGSRQRYVEHASLVLVAITAKWFILDALLRRLNPDWQATASLPVLNVQMALAVGIAGSAWWTARVFAARAAGRCAAAPATAGPPPLQRLCDYAVLTAVTLVLIALSFEIDRAVLSWAAEHHIGAWRSGHVWQLALTLLWAFGALAVGLVGMMRRRERVAALDRVSDPFMAFAWTVLVLCMAKWVVVDTFAWRLRDVDSLARNAWPLANAQMLGALALCLIAGLLLRAVRRAKAEIGDSGPFELRKDAAQQLAEWIPAAAGLLLLWGLTFEVDRIIGRSEAAQPAGWKPVWPPLQLRELWWTLLWAAGGVAMIVIARFRPRRSWLFTGALLVVGAALTWLTVDTLGWRLARGVALSSVVWNPQFTVGALLIVWLEGSLAIIRRTAGAVELFETVARPGVVTFALIAAIGLWLGSFEIDRFFAPEWGRFERAAMARQTGLSIYWGLYGIALVALGFVRRASWSRYVGLALLAVTLAKVLTIDMAEVRYVYRVLSLLGVGLLFVVTSVAYTKLAPVLRASAAGGSAKKP